MKFIPEQAYLGYDKFVGHRATVNLLSGTLLVLFAIFFFGFKTAQVGKYEGADMWFFLFHRFFWGFVLLTLTLVLVRAFYFYLDWTGQWDKEEAAVAQAKGLGAKPLYRPNWLFVATMLAEAFVYAALMMLVIPWICVMITGKVAPQTALPQAPLDLMIHYQSNPGQDLGLAFGSAFYEEFLFRVGLIWLFQHPKNTFLPKLKSPWIAIAASAIFYSISHFILPYSEPFSFYSLLYRFFLGMSFSLLLIWRKFGISAWTHAFYEIFYFVFI